MTSFVFPSGFVSIVFPDRLIAAAALLWAAVLPLAVRLRDAPGDGGPARLFAFLIYGALAVSSATSGQNDSFHLGSDPVSGVRALRWESAAGAGSLWR